MMKSMILPKGRSVFLNLVICILITTAFYFGSWLRSYKNNVIMMPTDQKFDTFLKDKASNSSNHVLRPSNQMRYKEIAGIQTEKKLALNREHRLNYIRKKCQRKTNRSVARKNLNYILVNDKYKILMCYIPKIACTQWKKIFLLMTGKFDSNPSVLRPSTVHTKYVKYLNFLSSYSDEEVRFRLKNYKRAIFLRDPLERLLSAYRNKMIGTGFSDKTFQKIAKFIVKNYRANASSESLKNGSDVTFQEFVNYVLDYRITGLNDHWQRYTKICHPCYVDYNFIGKFETLEEDANFLLKSLGVPSNITFPSTRSHNKTLETYNHFYSSVKLESILRLWDIYKEDYELFGYSFIDALKPLSSNQTNF